MSKPIAITHAGNAPVASEINLSLTVINRSSAPGTPYFSVFPPKLKSLALETDADHRAPRVRPGHAGLRLRSSTDRRKRGADPAWQGARRCAEDKGFAGR